MRSGRISNIGIVPEPKKHKQIKPKIITQKSGNQIKEVFVRLQRLSSSEILNLVNKPITASMQNNPSTVALVKSENITNISCQSTQNPNILWNKTKKIGSNAAVGQIVMAKMRKYRPWPAVIRENHRKTVLWVQFLGKGSEGSVKKTDCANFEHSIECVTQFLKNPVDDFPRTVREAEILLEIPHGNSLLRNPD